jgi:hypothetical protein
MNRPLEPQGSADDLDLPERLIADLHAAFRKRVEVPEALDRTIFEAARLRLRRRRGALVRRWAAAAAAAAALALAATLAWRGGDPADLDGNGRIDILDAFALARRLEAGAAPEPRRDIDGDGRVDRRDVDAIARRAVALRRG